jgi:hypothetical protein
MDHDIEKARNLKLILSVFEQLSGLKINFHKSELFCFGEAQAGLALGFHKPQGELHEWAPKEKIESI